MGGRTGAAAGSSGSGRPSFGDSGLVLPDASSQSFDASGPDVCSRERVVTGRVTPTVMLIIDQSSSILD
jgi:hypothetical protein